MMQSRKNPVAMPPVHAEHQAVVESYLGSIRTASEDFAEAFRLQTEALFALKDKVDDAGSELPTKTEADREGVSHNPTRRSGQARDSRGTPDLFN